MFVCYYIAQLRPYIQKQQLNSKSWFFRGHQILQPFHTSKEGKREAFLCLYPNVDQISCLVMLQKTSHCRSSFLITRGTKSQVLPAKTTQNYDTHKYSTTLPPAISPIILTVTDLCTGRFFYR